MYFKFADIPVIDGHIHFSHPELMEDVVRIMETVPYTGINLVSTPNAKTLQKEIS